jgi:hypothetical protein
MARRRRVSRSPWNFGGGGTPGESISNGGGGDLGRRRVGDGLAGNVALDGHGERGELRVADHAREPRSASSIPAAVQRRHMSPFCQRLTLRLVRRTVSITALGMPQTRRSRRPFKPRPRGPARSHLTRSWWRTAPVGLAATGTGRPGPLGGRGLRPARAPRHHDRRARVEHHCPQRCVSAFASRVDRQHGAAAVEEQPDVGEGRARGPGRMADAVSSGEQAVHSPAPQHRRGVLLGHRDATVQPEGLLDHRVVERDQRERARSADRALSRRTPRAALMSRVSP